jgi:hypothetical protein
MLYDLTEHRHRFSVWAAARATQRGFTSVEKLRDALEHSGVVVFLANRGSADTDAQAFDALHCAWCRSIIEYLQSKGVRNVTFGRAAKLIAVYLKGIVILGGSEHSTLSRVTHPPIDAILLRNICRAPAWNSTYGAAWRRIRWTQLDEKKYYTLINQLRQCLADGEPFWILEQYWTVTNEAE